MSLEPNRHKDPLAWAAWHEREKSAAGERAKLDQARLHRAFRSILSDVNGAWLLARLAEDTGVLAPAPDGAERGPRFEGRRDIGLGLIARIAEAVSHSNGGTPADRANYATFLERLHHTGDLT